MRKTAAVLILVLVATVSVSQACRRVRVNPNRHFHASYYVAGEEASHRIQVDDTTLTYIYYVVSESTTAHLLWQKPCCSDSDLKTVTAALPRSELSELAQVVNKSGFLHLQDRIGGQEGEKPSAPHFLRVGSDGVEKQVVFLSGVVPPKPWVAVRGKLIEMARAKFVQTCPWLK